MEDDTHFRGTTTRWWRCSWLSLYLCLLFCFWLFPALAVWLGVLKGRSRLEFTGRSCRRAAAAPCPPLRPPPRENMQAFLVTHSLGIPRCGPLSTLSLTDAQRPVHSQWQVAALEGCGTPVTLRRPSSTITPSGLTDTRKREERIVCSMFLRFFNWMMTPVTGARINVFLKK